jgi:hypothetical protein
MIGPHTKNGILKDGKRNIRMECNEEPMDRMTKDFMAT